MRRYSMTSMFGVPTMFRMLVDRKGTALGELSSPRVCSVARAPIATEVVSAFERLTGATLLNIYGATRGRGDLARCSAPRGAPGVLARSAVLAVDAVRQDDREPTFRFRSEDVGAQDNPVTHFDPDVFLDLHLIPIFRHGMPQRSFCSRHYDCKSIKSRSVTARLGGNLAVMQGTLDTLVATGGGPDIRMHPLSTLAWTRRNRVWQSSLHHATNIAP